MTSTHALFEATFRTCWDAQFDAQFDVQTLDTELSLDVPTWNVWVKAGKQTEKAAFDPITRTRQQKLIKRKMLSKFYKLNVQNLKFQLKSFEPLDQQLSWPGDGDLWNLKLGSVSILANIVTVLFAFCPLFGQI